MWTELKATDLTSKIETYATMINNCGCWPYPITALNLLNNLENKINCRYFFYNIPKFKIGLSFKYNQGTKKMKWVVFLIIGCKEVDYPEALLILAEKTKEVLKYYQVDLWNEYDYKELEELNESFKIGYDKLFLMLKAAFESIGLTCTYDHYQSRVML